jgi:hypothetical protein
MMSFLQVHVGEGGGFCMILHMAIYLENFRQNLEDHMKDYEGSLVLHFFFFSPNDLCSFILILE